MNDLPNELVTFIFEHLKIKDLMRCSLVCKRFKLLCRGIKIPELIITNTNENIKKYWFYTNKQFNLRDAINVTTFNSYQFRMDKFRRLYFAGSPLEFAQMKVNELRQLEQLKINIKCEIDVEHEIHINLPNLRMIEIHTSQANLTFIITTPKLEMLKCWNFDDIHLTYPNTIKHLETEFYSDSFHVLKNLQFLLITRLGEFNWSNTLSAFPQLTTLACNGSIGSVPTEIKNLVEYKFNHQRSEPNIYFVSVKLDDVKKIDDYNNYPDDFRFQINNYDSLAETVSIPSLGQETCYNDLMDLTKGKIPEDFYKKYFSVTSVDVNENVENQVHLIRFLKNFTYLTELILDTDSLDQSFYNELYELDQLTSLSVDISSKSNINFDFLFQLKRLHSFHTHIDSPKFFDLTPELFRLSSHFSYIRFYYEKKLVRIKANRSSNNYKVQFISDGTIHEKCQLDFNGLVRELDAMKSQLVDHY